MSYSTLTLHASLRGEERLNLNADSTVRLADKALEVGFKRNQFSGQFGRYLDKLYLTKRSANNMRIYGDHIYLFHDSTLITILNLPNHFKNAVAKARKSA